MSAIAFWVYGIHAGVKERIFRASNRNEGEQWVGDYVKDNPDKFQKITIVEGDKDKPTY